MSGRPVRAVPVAGADGLPLLGPLREALSGAGPALAPHPAGRPLAAAAGRPLGADEDDLDDPVAAVVSTTGSTGRAKHVLLPASALLSSAGATHDALGGAGTWLLPVPAYTVAGVQVLVRSLVAGTRPEVLDLADGFRPSAFAGAASALAARARGRRYTSLVPAQLDLLLADGPDRAAAVGALRSFDAVLVGGAALPGSLRSAAEDAGVRVVATYGMTETCGGCVYDGVPLPGVEVRLAPLDGTAGVEGDAQDLSRRADGTDGADGADGPGVVGRVVLGGPVVARGYRTDGTPAGGAPGEGSVVEGFVVEAGVRWFRTADRGVLDAGGDVRGADRAPLAATAPVRLRVLGRTDDVVVSGGTNVALDAVDRVVRARPGVRDCLVVALPSPRWGAVVAALLVDDPSGPGADDEAVRAAVRRELGAAAVPRLLRHVDRLPLTGVGKPDRAAAAALLGPADAAPPVLGDHGHPQPPTEETT